MSIRILRTILGGIVSLAAATASSASTFVVTTTADSGPGSLRQAINDANANGSGTTDAITFAIGGGGPYEIAPTTPLPVVQTRVDIDGYSQPGSLPNAAASSDFDGTLVVALKGVDMSPALTFGPGSDGSSVRGLIVYGQPPVVFPRPSVIRIDGAADVTVAGCLIGFSAPGVLQEAPVAVAGVEVRSSPGGIRIGGSTPADRNWFGRVGDGITITSSTGVSVAGNHFFAPTPPSPFGSAVMQTAVVVENSSQIQIGGATQGHRNVVGNATFGVRLIGSGTGIVVEGNYIGLATDGISPRPISVDGIEVRPGAGSHMGVAVRRNVVANVGFVGIELSGGDGGTLDAVVQGNIVGLTAALGEAEPGVWAISVSALPASSRPLIGGIAPGEGNDIGTFTQTGIYVSNAAAEVSGNRVRTNGGFAVQIWSDALGRTTPPSIAVTGAGSSREISGTLAGTASTSYRIEYFGGRACNAFGRADTEFFLGSTIITTDATGTGAFSSGPFAVPTGAAIYTATAFPLVAGRSTSQLSSCQPTQPYSLSGVIRDALGRSIPGMAVTLALSGSAPKVAVTGDDGAYAFTGIPRGSALTIRPTPGAYTLDLFEYAFGELDRTHDSLNFVAALPFYTNLLAEGATGPLFKTAIGLLNATDSATTATLSFLRDDGVTIEHALAIPPRESRRVRVEEVAGLQEAAFSTSVVSSQPIVVDRVMTWGQGDYGSHAEEAVATPATTWYMAEGATINGFQTFYLLQNPDTASATVHVRYLRPAPLPPLVKTYSVPPQSRFTIWTNQEQFDHQGVPTTLLASAEFSSEVTSDCPIVVERAMYLSTTGRIFEAGHASAASPALGTVWTMAEGATGPYFDMFVLIANPSNDEAEVSVRYLLPAGPPVVRTLKVPPASRHTIWVDQVSSQLDDTAVSVQVTSTNGVPVLVERSMWWPGESPSWREAHNSVAAPKTGTLWAFASGETGGPGEVETYVLVGNTSPFRGLVRARFFFADGSLTREGEYFVPANSRFNIPMTDFAGLTNGKTFGMTVESLPVTQGTAQIVVEFARYGPSTEASGARWANGANAIATRVR